jgi:hypothetical protein
MKMALSSEDLLERIRAEIDARCAELRPRLDEYRQLLSAAEALESPTGEEQPRAGKRGTRAVKGAKAKVPAKAPARAPAKVSAKAPAKVKAARRGPRASTVAKDDSSASTRAPRGAAQAAILAALEHGSHTVAELGVVTAMSGQNIRENLRRLLGAGRVTRAKREGKAAYALATPSSA